MTHRFRDLTRRLGVMTAALGLSAMGCGSDDSGGGGGGGAAAAAGSGGSGGGGGTTSGCFTPESSGLFPSGGVGDNVIFQTAVDGDWVYFSTVDTLYRVSVEGGAPEELYHYDLAVLVVFWVRDDHLLIKQGRKLLSMPKSGGATTQVGELTWLPEVSLAGEVDMVVVGDIAFGKQEEQDITGVDPTVVTYFALDLNTYASTELLTVNDLGDNEAIAANASGIFVADVDPATGGDFETLFRIPASGGPAEPLTTSTSTARWAAIGAVASGVILLEIPDGIADTRVLRAPITGGAPEELLTSGLLLVPVVDYIDRGSFGYLRALDTFYRVPTGAAPEEAFCVVPDSHSFAVSDSHAFVGVLGAEADMLKVPL
jgi:hypothetical protein